MIDINSQEYWNKLLEQEWQWLIDININNELANVKNNVDLIIEDIDDISSDIEVIENEWLLKFYLDNTLIWIIEYSKTNNGEIYIDMVWNINADLEDFDKYDFKERYDFEKNNIKIKWLIFHMYKVFFNILKNQWYNLAFWVIENENLYYVNDELVNRKIIKKSYTRINKNNKEELVREF